MKQRLEEAGHWFDTSWITRADLLSEEEKEHNLSPQREDGHSLWIDGEREETFLLSNNLRVCGDCHAASKMPQRSIAESLSFEI